MVNLLHRMWLGPEPMPKTYREFGDKWRELNPTYEVIDWSWHNLPVDLSNGEVLSDIRSRCTSGSSRELPTAIADVVAYDLVFRFGGVYANADIQPVAPLSELTVDGRPWATYEEKNYPLVVNAFFGSDSAEDTFWQKVVQNLSEHYFSLNRPGSQSVEMVFSSGPHYLTKCISEFGDNFLVLPFFTVNPFLWKEIEVGSDASHLVEARGLPKGCVGVHHWGHKKYPRTNVVK